jgi:hypothetical protein
MIEGGEGRATAIDVSDSVNLTGFIMKPVL